MPSHAVFRRAGVLTLESSRAHASLNHSGCRTFEGGLPHELQEEVFGAQFCEAPPDRDDWNANRKDALLGLLHIDLQELGIPLQGPASCDRGKFKQTGLSVPGLKR